MKTNELAARPPHAPEIDSAIFSTFLRRLVLQLQVELRQIETWNYSSRRLQTRRAVQGERSEEPRRHQSAIMSEIREPRVPFGRRLQFVLVGAESTLEAAL